TGWSGSPSMWKIDALAFLAPSPRLYINSPQPTEQYVQVLRVSRVRSSLYCRVSASATPGAKPSAAAVVPAIPPAQILKNCLLLTCMGHSLFRHCLHM